MKAAADYRSILTQNLKWKREYRKRSLQRFISDKNLSAGAVIFLLVVLLAVFGPLLSGRDPYAMDVTGRLRAPDGVHILGTDEFGRDLLTRVVYGARVSIGIGAVVTFFASILGMVIGVYASYYFVLDHIFMRICDGMSAFPGILLAIAFTAILGASARNVIIALSIVYVPGVARVVRSTALVVKNAPFIEALKTQGAGDLRIIWRHIVPNVLSPLLVQASFVFAGAILSEASLSFLGAGIPAPSPSWGNILQAGKGVIHKAWWMVVFPGFMIILSVLSLTMLGDGLRDFLDPHTGDAAK
ncbi:MAG: ABC transporter permease [Spirochaetaceae bacterium]|jgi:peptide/nickel transport system permease protein|nr:ABC transporter permease [Spirochaetaceae bacterium]